MWPGAPPLGPITATMDFCHGPRHRLKAMALPPPCRDMSYISMNRREQTCLLRSVDWNQHACKSLWQFVTAIGIFRIRLAMACAACGPCYNWFLHCVMHLYSQENRSYHKTNRVGCQEDGIQGQHNQAVDARNVNLIPNQPPHVEATSRTTRAMARAAGGLWPVYNSSNCILSFCVNFEF